MALLDIIIFLISWVMLFISSRWLVKSLARLSRFLGWREFIVSFFIVSIVGSTPNLFVGVLSALNKVPQLSLGDVLGGNLIDLSLVIGLAALFAKKGIPAKSRTVQTTALYTIFVAILPILLISDGVLGRADAIILILLFIAYLLWVFSNKERFTLIYPGKSDETWKKEVRKIKESHGPFVFFERIKIIFKNAGIAIAGTILMAIASIGIVKSSLSIIHIYNIYPIVFGTLIISFGNCLTDAFFSIDAAIANRTWMILGDLMGSVIVTGTLVLGIVALICPINVPLLLYFSIARVFLIVAALLFLFFIRTGKVITKKEASILFLVYIVFIIIEFFAK